MRLFVGLLLGSIPFAGCISDSAPRTFDPTGYSTSESPPARDASGSLFPSDQAVMSNEAIEAVLSTKVTLPSAARIAVVRMTPPRYWIWSEELARMDEAVLERFVASLAKSSRAGTVAMLPALLLPQRPTLPLLREAAARRQADVVVIYQVFTRTFERQKFLASDQTKAYCNVQAVVLDTRSGIVPFAATATEVYEARRSSDDLSFSETIWKAELSATGKALERIAAEIVKFLDAER